MAGFANIARPLHNLLKEMLNGGEFRWTPEHQATFSTIIEKVCEDVTLDFPDFKAASKDPKRAFVVQTDASRSGLAGILGQLDGAGKSRPIYFASRACTETESRYSATELEALALTFALKKFAPFIIGLETIVETDHSALVQMFNCPKECGSARVNKWAMYAKSLFNLVVRYRPGKSNANADALSRAFEGCAPTPTIAKVTVQAESAVPIPTNVTRDEWILAQRNGDFGDIYKYLEDHTLPTEEERAQNVLHLTTSFTTIDSCLHFIDPNTLELRLVVPEKYQHLLFHERHAGVFGVHYSGRKIFQTLKKRYY